jgi:hypothetical protein
LSAMIKQRKLLDTKILVTVSEESRQEATVKVCHPVLKQLRSLAGGVTRIESRRRATISGTHRKALLGR